MFEKIRKLVSDYLEPSALEEHMKVTAATRKQIEKQIRKGTYVPDPEPILNESIYLCLDCDQVVHVDTQGRCLRCLSKGTAPFYKMAKVKESMLMPNILRLAAKRKSEEIALLKETVNAEDIARIQHVGKKSGKSTSNRQGRKTSNQAISS